MKCYFCGKNAEVSIWITPIKGAYLEWEANFNLCDVCINDVSRILYDKKLRGIGKEIK